MLYYMLILGLGIGIGCSIASSDTEKIPNNMVRTKYLRNVYGYEVGWTYDKSIDGGLYVFTLQCKQISSNEQNNGMVNRIRKIFN